MNLFRKIKKVFSTLFIVFGIFRSENGLLGGVCSGISERFNFRVGLVRLIFFLSLFFTFGTSILLYLLAVILIPKKSYSQNNFKNKNQDYVDVNSREL